MDKKKANLFAKLALLIVAILWGSSLTVVKQSSKTFNPNFILAIRFTLAAILLSIIFWKRLRQAKFDDLKSGLLIGIFLFMAYSSQTLGVKFADPGRSGFLSASYCVIVPFLGWIVFKQRPDRYNLAASAVCITGIFFISLSLSSALVDNPLAWLGDLLALLSGLLFASHIIAVSALAKGRSYCHDDIAIYNGGCVILDNYYCNRRQFTHRRNFKICNGIIVSSSYVLSSCNTSSKHMK